MASSVTVYASTAINPLIRRNKQPSHFPLHHHHNHNHNHTPPSSLFLPYPLRFQTLSTAASKKSNSSTTKNTKLQDEDLEEVVEEEEDLPWIQDKALDLVEFTGSVTQAVPGPRVGSSSLPWLLAVPLAYVGVTFVIAVVRTVKKLNSPKEKKRQLVNKNLTLCKGIDELFEKGRDNVQYSALKDIVQRTGFTMEEIVRKYIRYALNEKTFDLNLIANLIQLRKASMLDDSKMASVINNISKRIVRDKGPVVMDMTGYSAKGFERKMAVQSLFGKLYYLSELPEFCSRDRDSLSEDSSLKVKEVFGVTDEDAEKLRLHTMSEVGDVESLEMLMNDSDLQNSSSNESS